MKGWVSFAGALLLLAWIPGCGAVLDPSAVVIAITVEPGPTSARVGNGVTFSVDATYSDGHIAPLDHDVTWTHDSLPWVNWSDTTAQCVAPSPEAFGVAQTAKISASASINGNTFTDQSGIQCTQ